MNVGQLPIGVLKFTPESFIVQELLSGGEVVPLCKKTVIYGNRKNAPVTLFHLTKSGVATPQAIEVIARQLKVEARAVSCQGLKDRHALTSQLIGVKGDFKPRFWHKDMYLQQVGYSSRELQPGRNKGNRFDIEVMTDAGNIDDGSLSNFANYFGSQRIGTREGCEIGKLLFEGDFDKAAKIFLADSPDPSGLQQAYARKGSWRGAWLDDQVRFEFKFRLQRWQSLLWNDLVAQLPHHKMPERFPMWDQKCSGRYSDLWNPSSINRDAERRMVSFSRPTSAKASNLTSVRTARGWRFGFDLRSGVYATVALSQVFNLREG